MNQYGLFSPVPYALDTKLIWIDFGPLIVIPFVIGMYNRKLGVVITRMFHWSGRFLLKGVGKNGPFSDPQVVSNHRDSQGFLQIGYVCELQESLCYLKFSCNSDNSINVFRYVLFIYL